MSVKDARLTQCAKCQHGASPPDGWQEMPLGTVADIRFSGVDKKSYAGEEPVRLCNYTDVYNNEFIRGDEDFMRATATDSEISRFALESGDVIITKDSETPYDIGIPAVIEESLSDVLCGYHLALIRPRQDCLDPIFLAKQLAHDRLSRYFARSANGLTRYGLPTAVVENVPLWVPALDEQQRVARVLRGIDETIAKTEALIAKLKAIKQGLLHDLLTRGLDEDGQLRDPRSHPEQFKNSTLGPLPRSWDVVPLGSIATSVTSGSRGWATYYSEQGAVFLRISNLTREHIHMRFDDVQHVELPSGMTEARRTRVGPGDILISITADLGVIGVCPENIGEAYVNQHIASVKLDTTEANAYWIGNYLASGPSQRQFHVLNDQGAKAGMNLPTVERLLIAKPTMSEQARISIAVSEIDQRICAETAHCFKLTHIKKGLMQDLLSGRVRVKSYMGNTHA